eukprot:CAMPEP_0202689606 /NCGR_PEP_ID=MMETSP1385-20130828/4814_1 /ASSEMBLY_ACC=CAM_ASM_000861 /TAXON_ID=933848 /ORGANISM="Elphidium margaritaceum" /LENGTH=446 /DNA_ID=CAMNT_0049344755 /DNA_START=47 /DNA_END=1387 /DNA_ORIENTATION=-
MKRKHPDDSSNLSSATASNHNKKTRLNQIIINTNVVNAFGPQTLYPQMSTTQSEQPQAQPVQACEEYAIYGQHEEMLKVEKLIRDLDVMMAAIRDDGPHYPNMKRSNQQCKLYTQCASALCAPNQEKLRNIQREIENTDRYISNKYDFAERVVHNKCEEEVRRATQALIAKYEDKRNREERSFKHSFSKYRHRINKAKKQLSQQQQQSQQQQLATDEKTTTTTTTTAQQQLEMQTMQDELETLFSVEKYPRCKLLTSKTKTENETATATAASSAYPSFNDPQMQQKWCKIRDLAKTDMADDVNCMVCDDGNASSDVSDTSTSTSTHSHQRTASHLNRLEIRDILAMFPVCDVLYRSDKNTITVNYVRSGGEGWSETLKVGSLIACQYTKQSVMRGPIVTISSTGIWCHLRKNSKQCAKFEDIEDHILHEIKLQSIEDGTVKIKLIE